MFHYTPSCVCSLICFWLFCLDKVMRRSFNPPFNRRAFPDPAISDDDGSFSIFYVYHRSLRWHRWAASSGHRSNGRKKKRSSAVAATSRRSRPQCDSRSISIVIYIYISILLFRPVARSTPHWWIVRILLLLHIPNSPKSPSYYNTQAANIWSECPTFNRGDYIDTLAQSKNKHMHVHLYNTWIGIIIGYILCWINITSSCKKKKKKRNSFTVLPHISRRVPFLVCARPE